MEIKEVKALRILNPTAIDLGDYVINPYRGCGYSCLYCYARFSKTALKDSRKWGDYVDVRINAPELLYREIRKKKPEKVLLGSTTECFSPVCRRNNVMRDILDILNENGVFYSILTRSPLIGDYLEQIKKGFCNKIFFTVNNFDKKLKKVLEPRSPAFTERIESINRLKWNGIEVIPYFSPVLPGISDIPGMFSMFPRAGEIGFEGLNFKLGNINRIIMEIKELYPRISLMYEKMKKDRDIYDRVWDSVRKEVFEYSSVYGTAYDLFIHDLEGYFENKYTEKNN
jgi:DNA repair photolyase